MSLVGAPVLSETLNLLSPMVYTYVTLETHATALRHINGISILKIISKYLPVG